jgi:hypothetical protein
MTVESVKLTVDGFGSVKDLVTNEQKEVKRFTWTNEKNHVSVQVILDFYAFEKHRALIFVSVP